jgi:hypothetical protein
MSHSALVEPETIDHGPWIELEPPDVTIVARLEAQYAMRFGSRAYTDAQASFINEVVRERPDLAEPPLPLED